MADTSPKTFPGVYTQITDQSFLPPQVSRFRPAFVGVTSKGPFDTPVRVRSLRDFIRTFGPPVSFTVDTQTGSPTNGTGFYVADAVQLAAEYTNDMTIVRVGNRTTALAGSVSGLTNYSVGGSAVASAVSQLLAQNGALYLRLSQSTKDTSVNMPVLSVSGGVINFDPSGPELADTYTTASVAFSPGAGAANKAEGVLYAYTYGDASSGTNSDSTPWYTDVKLTTYGTVTGSKNGTSFTVQSNGDAIEAGEVYSIKVDGNPYAADTFEVRVKNVVGNTVYLESTDQPRVGYQAVTLQDNYGGAGGNTAYLYKAFAKVPFLYLKAKTEGTWANGTSSTTGLFVRVRPGSAPGTKKLEVFENGALVETHDNLSASATSADYYATRLTASQYLEVEHVNADEVYHAANTAAPWDTNFYGINATAPGSMPVGAINAGNLSHNATSYYTGGQFSRGANGNSATEADYAGVFDATNDVYTGVQALKDPDNVDCNMIFAPMNLDGFDASDVRSGITVMEALHRTANAINAMAIADVPPGLTATEAIDWHNGTGAYAGRPRIDSHNIAIYWNWFTMVDRFTGIPKLVPPSLGALRCFGISFQRDKPWSAAAGELRGYIPEAQRVEFDRVGVDTRHAMYGQGNSVNPILKLRGRHIISGERTLQRAESKLTAIHSVILVNYVVAGLAEIGRRFVFEPNDPELLVHIRLAYSEFLDKVRNERGLEAYELVISDRNNDATTRNRREVIVDLALIPTDVLERLFINATVHESGARLNSVG